MTASRDVSALPSAEQPELWASIQPWTVTPTAEELAAGALKPENLGRAVEGLAVDGVVVLKGVVDTEHARLLHDRVLSDVRAQCGVPAITPERGPAPSYCCRRTNLSDTRSRATCTDCEVRDRRGKRKDRAGRNRLVA
jgi:hypothetical protein